MESRNLVSSGQRATETVKFCRVDERPASGDEGDPKQTLRRVRRWFLPSLLFLVLACGGTAWSQVTLRGPATLQCGLSGCCPGTVLPMTVSWTGAPVGFGPYVITWSNGGEAPAQVVSSLPVTIPVAIWDQDVDVQVTDIFGGWYTASANLRAQLDLYAISASVSGGGTVCIGTPQTIRVDLENYITGLPGWVLEWSDGYVETVLVAGSTYTHYRTVTPVAPTTYSVNLVRPPGLTFGGQNLCGRRGRGAATFNAAIPGLPSVSVSGSSAICPGDTAVVSVTLGSGLPTGPFTWSVFWADGLSETVTSPTQPYVHTRAVSPATTTTYSVAQVSQFCGNNTLIAFGSGSATISVSPSFPVSITSATLTGNQLRVTGAVWPTQGLPGTIHFHQTPLPTTVVSATELTATVPASMLGAAGGAAVHVVAESQAPGCWQAASNALSVSWDPARTNRGTIINTTTGPSVGNRNMTFRLEGGEPLQPLSMMVDLGFPANGSSFFPPLAVFGNQALSTYSPNAFPIIDGLQALGAFGRAPVASLDGGGGFAITIPALEPILAGVPFRLQAAYLDPTRPSQVSLTWPFEARVR